MARICGLGRASEVEGVCVHNVPTTGIGACVGVCAWTFGAPTTSCVGVPCAWT